VPAFGTWPSSGGTARGMDWYATSSMNRSPVGRAPCAWAGVGHITGHSRRAMAIARMRAGPMGTGEYIHWGIIEGGPLGGP